MAPDLKSVRLESRQVLVIPDEPIRHVYFPREAVVSLLVSMQNGEAIEGASVGNEGLVGLQVFLGDGAALDEAVVQIPGEAARMRVDTFRAAVNRDCELQLLLHRYTLALMNQLARTAGCNRIHSVNQRVARWLLKCRDGIGRNTFPITHESLANLLGVRRASVTVAVGALRDAGIIEYCRGRMTVVDPRRLEDAACEDYRLSRAAYAHVYD
jgi:CRP-like cAMP-binding protein